MRHIRSGDEVFVAGRDGVDAVVRVNESSSYVKATNIDEIIERLKKRKEDRGLALLDGDFEADVQEARARYNAPLDGSRWD